MGRRSSRLRQPGSSSTIFPTVSGYARSGEMAIADADRPQRLFQLDIEGLRAEFPALRVWQLVLTPTPERLVERADELATLAELVESAYVGAGRFGVIVGDAGIGKTTLVSEVRLAAELRGMEVLQARVGG